ncbi:hypothetical protein N7461_003460 [Penicillium sp. DV-2018c]|nr:hypothetical protein N7461_003460 [Penicillium sp. DV-2018c]
MAIYARSMSRRLFPSNPSGARSNNLPPELLDIIISHLDFPTTKAIRLVNRILCFCATPYVFSEIILFLEKRKSCKTFKSIIAHPELKGRVRKVRVNIAREEKKPEVEIFYASMLKEVWLKPTMESLENLSLYSNLYWGFYPHFDLESMRFPNLKSLTLGKFVFFDDYQFIWILRHYRKLEELNFDRCSILARMRTLNDIEHLSRCPISTDYMTFHEDEDFDNSAWYWSYERRWSNYFAASEKGLPRLRHFAFGESKPDQWSELPFENESDIQVGLMVDRYLAFDSGSKNLFMTVHDMTYPSESYWPSCVNDDREALMSLYIKIGQRPKWWAMEKWVKEQWK